MRTKGIGTAGALLIAVLAVGLAPTAAAEDPQEGYTLLECIVDWAPVDDQFGGPCGGDPEGNTGQLVDEAEECLTGGPNQLPKTDECAEA